MTDRHDRIARGVLAGLLLFALARPATAGEWKGHTATRDGAVIVENPAKGFEAPLVRDLELLWTIGGETDDEDEMFGVIADVALDADGNVYLLDAQLNEVKIFDADGNFLRSIGREGEGPGEFRRAGSLLLEPDGRVAVIQTVPARVVLLEPEGDPAGEAPLPKPDGGGFQLVMGAKRRGGNTVMLFARQGMDASTMAWKRETFLASVDAQGHLGARYVTRENIVGGAAPELNDATWMTFDRRWTIGPDGRVYACPSFADYEVHVWAKDGRLERIVRREYEHRPRDAKEKKFFRTLFSFYAKMIPNCTVTVADDCPDIQNVWVRDDGTLWVLSSRGSRDHPDGTLGVFDVYNPEGQFVRTVTLRGKGHPRNDLYVFAGERLYVVSSFMQAAMAAQGIEGLYDEDDEAEPMAVRCYRLGGDVLATR